MVQSDTHAVSVPFLLENDTGSGSGVIYFVLLLPAIQVDRNAVVIHILLFAVSNSGLQKRRRNLRSAVVLATIQADRNTGVIGACQQSRLTEIQV